jgi:lysozyme
MFHHIQQRKIKMEKINLVVVDLSHHDPASNYEAAKNSGIVGVIFKATEGGTYNDPEYMDQKAKAKAAGLLWGSYHFGNATNVKEQINNYLDFTDPDVDELICLDFEDNEDNSMSLNQAKLWIQGVEEELEREGECVLYSGNRIKEQMGNRLDDWWASHRLWIAQYGNVPTVPACWAEVGYWLWQYSGDGVGPEPHDVPGIGKDIDCNSFNGSLDRLYAEWATGKKEELIPPIPPVPPVETKIVKIDITVPPGVIVEISEEGIIRWQGGLLGKKS